MLFRIQKIFLRDRMVEEQDFGSGNKIYFFTFWKHPTLLLVCLWKNNRKDLDNFCCWSTDFIPFLPSRLKVIESQKKIWNWFFSKNLLPHLKTPSLSHTNKQRFMLKVLLSNWHSWRNNSIYLLCVCNVYALIFFFLFSKKKSRKTYFFLDSTRNKNHDVVVRAACAA